MELQLIQVFDVNTEGDVRSAIGDTTAKPDGNKKQRHNDLLKKIYNNEITDKTTTNEYDEENNLTNYYYLCEISEI